MASPEKHIFTLKSDFDSLIFDLDRNHFDSPLSKEYQCSICFNLVKNPLCCSAQCLSLFCESCVQAHLSSMPDETLHTFCPSCRFRGDSSTIFKHAIDSRRIMRNLSVRCVFHDQGCEWKGIFGKKGEHLFQHLTDSCGEILIPCTAQCSDTGLIQRKQMQQHLEHQCPNRIMVCPYCHADFTYKNQKQHFLACDSLPVSCPYGCSDPFSKVQLSAHLQDQCPNMTHPCPFKCAVDPMSSMDLSKHLKDHSNAHLKMVQEENRRLTENMSWLLSSTSTPSTDVTKRINRMYPTVDGPCAIDLSNVCTIFSIHESHPSLKWLENKTSERITRIQRHLIVLSACFNHDQTCLYLGGYLTCRSSILTEREKFCDDQGNLNGLFRYNLLNSSLEHLWSWPDHKHLRPCSMIMIGPEDAIFQGKTGQFPQGALLVFFDNVGYLKLFCFNPNLPVNVSLHVVDQMDQRRVWKCDVGSIHIEKRKFFWNPHLGKLIYICSAPLNSLWVMVTPIKLYENDHRVKTKSEVWSFDFSEIHSCAVDDHQWDFSRSFLSDDGGSLYLFCLQCTTHIKSAMNYNWKKLVPVEKGIQFETIVSDSVKVLTARQDCFGMFEFVTVNKDKITALHVYNSKSVFQFTSVLSTAHSTCQVLVSDKNQLLLLREPNEQLVTVMNRGQLTFSHTITEKWKQLQQLPLDAYVQKDTLMVAVESVVDQILQRPASTTLKRNLLQEEIKDCIYKKTKIEECN